MSDRTSEMVEITIADPTGEYFYIISLPMDESIRESLNELRDGL